MDIRQQVKKFDEENKPFYMVDHGDGEYSLCLPLSSLKGEYSDFGQEAFNQYAVRAGEPVTDGRFYTHGDGYEWEYVFEKAFEGEENLKKISFDCEAGGFFCYSNDFEILAEYGRRFREICMKEQEFTELVCSALSEDRQPVEEEISTEGMTPFFSAVAELAKEKGFKLKGVKDGALTLTLKGEFAVMVDETGASIVPMIQSFAQLNKNYGKEGAEIIIDNCQDTIFGGFAPNSESAEVLSKSLGNKTVMSGSISRGKNDPSQSLQMIQRPLMTPDELKSLPKGNFIVSKTGSHPMRTKLKLFLKWGITFEEPYEIEEKSARKVAYADKQEIEEEIIRRYMCCVDEEPENSEPNPASRSGGMLQTQMNETVAKVRQSLRTED